MNKEYVSDVFELVTNLLYILYGPLLMFLGYLYIDELQGGVYWFIICILVGSFIFYLGLKGTARSIKKFDEKEKGKVDSD
ncbi:hypothetical protein [Alkalibacillus almallahensis]|uniref:hypothetical protein n=1 Tax=Alkalibacillus almallahensis TaxID=1379154 RepID=UPI00141E7705|nr:hypothetical protein [Alkalibacillus almallahensis]